MELQSLTVYRFRNLADQTVQFSPGLNFITGNNGQGKTNLLEAVHVLSTAKSFRTSETKELIAWNEEAASTFGKVRRSSHRDTESNPGGQAASGPTLELGVIISRKDKRALLDGRELAGFTELFGKFISVTFVPQDLDLVKGAPAERRSFLDRHVCEVNPSLVRHYVTYQKALRSKAALLKGSGVSEFELEPWNRILSEHALPIVEARRQMLLRLAVLTDPILDAIAQQPSGLGLQLKTEVDQTDQEAVFESFMAVSGRELATRQCVFGPQRDDVLISLQGQSSRSFASQGQTRSIVLALKLAVIELLESELGTAPVILLDDVESELDPHRRIALLRFLARPNRQVFITGTEQSELVVSGAEREKKVFRMEAGRLVE